MKSSFSSLSARFHLSRLLYFLRSGLSFIFDLTIVNSINQNLFPLTEVYDDWPTSFVFLLDNGKRIRLREKDIDLYYADEKLMIKFMHVIDYFDWANRSEKNWKFLQKWRSIKTNQILAVEHKESSKYSFCRVSLSPFFAKGDELCLCQMHT